MILRAATHADVPALAQVSEMGDVSGWTPENLTAHFDNGGAALVALEGGGIVGYILWRVVLDAAEIFNLVVSTKHRRHGYGRVLLRAAMDYFQGAGVLEIFLDVRADNMAAQALYRDEGFKEVAVRRNFYLLDPANPEASRDAQTMLKHFPKWGA